MPLTRYGSIVALVASCALSVVSGARGDEKVVQLDQMPATLAHFRLDSSGGQFYFGGAEKFWVVDEQGQVVRKIGLPEGSNPVELFPIESGELKGWFIAAAGYGGAHVGLLRPDGTEAKALVKVTGKEDGLHGDANWKTVGGAAIDVAQRRIFVLDQAIDYASYPPNMVWTRIAMFDFDGKYLGDIARYDASKTAKDDARNTRYYAVEVDAPRQVVYVTSWRTKELLAYSYDGKLLGKAPGLGGLPCLAMGGWRCTGRTIEVC